jgi:hypothetical protein
MAIGIVIASPAGAAKPDIDCDEKPNHPTCVDDAPDSLAGTTCAALGRWGDPVTGEFIITLGNVGELNGSECVDVMAAKGPWEVEIEIESGTVRSLMLVPRDSIAPGDSCGGVHIRKPAETFTVTLPGADGAYVNSCGLDFGEWANGLYYDTVETGIPSPLAFQMDMSGSKDAVVTLTVTVPEYVYMP